MWRWPLLMLAGCSPSGAIVSYAGSEHPREVEPAALESHAGEKPLPGYHVIGVVTARCELLDGASGLFATPCNEEAMLAAARERASTVGGHALFDPRCSERVVERVSEQVDGGSYQTTTRTEIACQATVARREHGPPPKAKPAPKRIPSVRSRERITVSGTAVAVSFDVSRKLPARDERDVGEMTEFPAGYPRLGKVTSECVSDCARSTAWRALRKKAAALGALAVTDPLCEPIGTRWRCRATLVGP